MKPLSIRISGFGGQGIILAAVILGTTMVKKGNFYVVQTQSYGSEARGGECQSELIISLFQSALDKYLDTLKKNGILIVDPKLVNNIPSVEAHIYKVPATEMAIANGNRIAANMVVLGFLKKLFKWANADVFREVIASTVKEKFVDVNLKAFDAGVHFAKNLDMTMEDGR